MKTVKISLVATLAAILAWRIRLPHRVWPTHPQLASLFIAIAICVVLQLAWTDPENLNETEQNNADGPEKLNPKSKSISRIN